MPWTTAVRGAVGVLLATTGVVAAPAGGAGASSAGKPAPPTRVSVSSAEAQGNASSFAAGLNADGRYVAFTSEASNLVRADTNNSADVFLRDRRAGTTQRISVASGGGQGNHESFGGSITPNGRYVAFTSKASNLVKGDTARHSDAFVRDLRTGRTIRVSVSSKGVQGNRESSFPQISAGGRHVVFRSAATNLVKGDTTAEDEIFVRDLRTSTTERVSVSSTGAQANQFSAGAAISADGRYVAFVSYATNLVRGDTNGAADVFLRDRRTRTTVRVNVGPRGVQADAGGASVAMTPDARYVVFDSPATNLVSPPIARRGGVYVRDLRRGVTSRVADGGLPAVSDNGRYVSFEAASPERPQVFVADRRTGTVTAASTPANGGAPDGFSSQSSLSGDGRLVAFRSAATNLVPGDTNGASDTFVRRIW